ncbi:MAG: BACON domain-containing protein [Bacteroidales bacterium]
MEKAGGTATITINSNTSWKVVIPEPWCVTNMTEGSASYEPVMLVFTIEKNTSKNERQQKIVLQSRKYPAVYTTITLVQEAGDEPEEPEDPEDPEEPVLTDTLTVTSSKNEIWCKGDSFDVTLYANTDWSFVASDQPWCELISEDREGGPGHYVLTFMADTTKQAQPRDAVLSFKTAADSIVTLSIRQRAVGLSLPEDLIAFRDEVNAGWDLLPWMDADSVVHMRADIDLSDAGNWVPIGMVIEEDRSFKGILDGNGHRITNLTLTNSYLPSVGFFGHIIDAEVRNLVLDESCLISIVIPPNREVSAGGICGTLEGGTISGCSFEGKLELTGTGANTAAGGIVGTMLVHSKIEGIAIIREPSYVSYCHNKGTIKGLHIAGGIVGIQEGGLTKGNEVHYSTNETGARVTAKDLAGGIAGLHTSNGKIENCVNSGFIQAVDGHAGGICAELSNYSSVLRCENTNQAQVQGAKYAGGICGYSFVRSTIKECSNAAEIKGVRTVGGICAVQMEQSSIEGCDNFGRIVTLAETEEENDGTAGIVGVSINSKIIVCKNEGPVTGISTAGGIVAYFSSNASVVFEKCSNASPVTGGSQVGGIIGFLQVKSASLKSLTNYGQISTPAEDAAAGGIAGAIKGLTVTVSDCINKEGAHVSARRGNAGGIAADAPDRGIQFSYCENHADIESGKWAAGIVAFSKDLISRCLNTGNIAVLPNTSSGENEYTLLAAGIAANTSHSIEHCTNKGQISAFNAAGISAQYAPTGTIYTIKNCINEGSVTGDNTAGGIVAFGDSGTRLENVENKASVTGSHRVGGIAATVKNGNLKGCVNSGAVSGTETELKYNYFVLGGICGANDGANLTECINKAPVTRLSKTGQYKFVGGVVGSTKGIGFSRGVLENCTNEGPVTGLQDVQNSCFTGGFCGFFASGPKPENCSNTGSVNGEEPNEDNEYGGHA